MRSVAKRAGLFFDPQKAKYWGWTPFLGGVVLLSVIIFVANVTGTESGWIAAGVTAIWLVGGIGTSYFFDSLSPRPEQELNITKANEETFPDTNSLPNRISYSKRPRRPLSKNECRNHPVNGMPLCFVWELYHSDKDYDIRLKLSGLEGRNGVRISTVYNTEHGINELIAPRTLFNYRTGTGVIWEPVNADIRKLMRLGGRTCMRNAVLADFIKRHFAEELKCFNSDAVRGLSFVDPRTKECHKTFHPNDDIQLDDRYGPNTIEDILWKIGFELRFIEESQSVLWYLPPWIKETYIVEAF